MLEGIVWEQVGLGSGWALVAIFVLGFIRGQLYGRKAMEDVLHDRDEWRTESRLKDQQIDEQGLQLRYMAEVGKTMEAILHSVHSLARSGGSRHEEEIP